MAHRVDLEVAGRISLGGATPSGDSESAVSRHLRSRARRAPVDRIRAGVGPKNIRRKHRDTPQRGAWFESMPRDLDRCEDGGWEKRRRRS
jgi:hypothetical protein